MSHSVTGDDALISLAGPANKQARSADAICGLDSRFAGAQARPSSVFDLTAATGLSEAAQSAPASRTTPVFPHDHAGYYPWRQGHDAESGVRARDVPACSAPRPSATRGVGKRIDVLAHGHFARGSRSTQDSGPYAPAPPPRKTR